MMNQKALKPKAKPSKELYRAVFEQVAEGIFLADVQGYFIEVNRQGCHLLGYTRDELLNFSWPDLIPPENLAAAPLSLHSLQAGKTALLKSQLRCKDGRLLPVEIRAHRLADNHLLAFVRNLIEPKQAKEQLLYEVNLLQYISDAIIATDLDFYITSWNAAAETIYGWKAAEVMGRSVHETLQTDFLDEQLDQVRRQFLEQGLWRGEVTQKCKNGNSLNILSSVALIKDAAGKPTGAVAVNRDITERKQTELALRQSEQILEHAQAMGHMGSWTADLQAGTFNSSTEGSRLVGWSPGAHQAEELFEVIHPDDLQYMQDAWQAAMTGAPYDIEHRIILDGQIRWLHIKAEIEFDHAGRPIKAAGITQDITERKQTEQEIRQLSETLEQRIKERTTQLEMANKELEAFSYSVSHDLRAPLRAIDGFARILLEDYQSQLDAEGQRYCGIIHSETQRMNQLIDDLLTFSRLNRAPLRISTINMNDLVAEVFATLITATDQARTDFSIKPLLPASGDLALIRQVWTNLLSNALKFSAKKERAIIRVSSQQQGTEIIYAIADNGAGFEMQYADKLFKVFQRLHGEAEFPGTGVGLAIVQRIIHRHGGRIWAESEVSQGATFFFTLSQTGDYP